MRVGTLHKGVGQGIAKGMGRTGLRQAKAGAQWLSGCMRRTARRTVQSAHGLLQRARKSSSAKSLALKVAASFPETSTRTLRRAVWLRSSHWAVWRRSRLTVPPNGTMTAQRAGRASGLVKRAIAHAWRQRIWHRPMRRAVRITRTVSMALRGLTTGLTMPMVTRQARPKPHATCRLSRRNAAPMYCNLMPAYRF
jgi:hypothetical protein